MSHQIAVFKQFPDPLTAVRQARLAASSRARYLKALGDYLIAGGDLYDPAALAEYAEDLPGSERGFLSAAYGLWVKRTMDYVKSQATPANVGTIQAALLRLEALRGAVAIDRQNGTRAHTWLNQAQVKSLFDHCPAGIGGERDRVALGLLVGAGLRREEAISSVFDDLKLQPRGERIRTVLSVNGKGNKMRLVPLSDALANAIDRWGQRVGSAGRMLRSLDSANAPGDSLSAVGLFKLVARYGTAIGKPELAAHDLRRTYAQLGYEAGVPLTQISRLLGHASVETTMTYLNLELDLETTVSDFIPVF